MQRCNKLSMKTEWGLSNYFHSKSSLKIIRHSDLFELKLKKKNALRMFIKEKQNIHAIDFSEI